MFTVRLEGGQNATRKLTALSVAARSPQSGLKAVGQLMKLEAARAFQSGRDPKTGRFWKASNGPLKRGKALYETGRLLGSITAAAPRVTKDSVSIGTTLPHAPVHHHGGTVKPKRAKSLAVPLTRRASRFTSPRNYTDSGGGAPGEGLFVFKSKRGNAFLAKSAAGGKLELLYLLLKQVKIPARPFLGFAKPARKTALAILGGHIKADAGLGPRPG